MNVIGTKQSLATVRYLFWRWNKKKFFLKYLEEILICFEEELLMLTSRTLFSYALWLWFFSICSLQRSLIYDVRKEQRGGSSRGHNIWPVLLMAVHGFSGRVIFYSCGRRHVRQSFFSVICKDFLHWFGSLALDCFLKACLIYNSVLETKEVQRFIKKVGSIIMYLYSCQFYYTYETCKHCVL